ncbi:helix-turn-helix transcriptional regulator [Hoeflea sp. BAL378]|uniref:helix-turn-helix transcriptional regulator n=1 Tax=Hoeflea sp. BAL378 TaxID=1547437 RepID=UPI001269BAE5|nr:helix-turn-helix transcriptional regulator [Hoeflea sp. BAL378]
MTGRTSSERAVVDGLFEAALAPELWTESLIALSDHVGGSSVNLIVLDRPGTRPVIEHFVRGNDDAYASYIGEYITVDRRVPRVAEAPVNKVLLEQHVLSDEEKRTDVVYNEVLATGGMRNMVLTNLTAGPLYMGLGVAPRDDAVPFEPDQLERISRILPDLRHALRFSLANRELQVQRGALGDLWAHAGKAVLILNSDRGVIFANGRAEDCLRTGLMRVRNGRLRFADRASDALLQHWLGRLAACPGENFGEFLADHPASRAQFSVRLIAADPIVASLPVGQAAAVIVMLEPLSEALVIGPREIERFCRLFGVTAAEGRAVAAVVAGRPLEELAAENQIAKDTVRKQLKAAMMKCGVSSQKALISRLERFCFVSLA